MTTVDILREAVRRGAVIEHAIDEEGREGLRVLPSTEIEGSYNREFRMWIHARRSVLLELLDPNEERILRFVGERIMDYLIRFPGTDRLELQAAISPECGGGWWLPLTCPYPKPADWDDTEHRTGPLHALAALAQLELAGHIVASAEGNLTCYYPADEREMRRAA